MPAALSESDFMELASMTEENSGSDIASIVKDPMTESVRTCQTAVKF
jgi:hypothetical protein